MECVFGVLYGERAPSLSVTAEHRKPHLTGVSALSSEPPQTQSESMGV